MDNRISEAVEALKHHLWTYRTGGLSKDTFLKFMDKEISVLQSAPMPSAMVTREAIETVIAHWRCTWDNLTEIVNSIYALQLPQAQQVVSVETMTFEQIKEAFLKFDWKSEYMQAAIVVLRQVFESHALLTDRQVKP